MPPRKLKALDANVTSRLRTLDKARKAKSKPKTKTPLAPTPSDLGHLERMWAESRERNPVLPHQLPPGIHLGVSFEDYLRIPAINASSLRLAKKSLAHYRYAPPLEDKPYFRLGSLIHCGKLEPEELEKRYVVLPDKELVERVQAERTASGQAPYDSPKATKLYKESVRQFMALHPGKQEVSTDWFDDMAGILRALEANPISKKLFQEGFPEVTLIAKDPETGLLLKGRTDYLSSTCNCLVDLKTTDDIFKWNLDKFDYHIQAAFYLHVYELAYRQTDKSSLPAVPNPHLATDGLLAFWFAVVEKTRPWTVIAAPASANALRVGWEETQFLLRQVAEAVGNQKYPKVDHVATWDLSRWYEPFKFPLAIATDLGEFRPEDMAD